jgi:hypothetical protein
LLNHNDNGGCTPQSWLTIFQLQNFLTYGRRIHQTDYGRILFGVSLSDRVVQTDTSKIHRFGCFRITLMLCEQRPKPRAFRVFDSRNAFGSCCERSWLKAGIPTETWCLNSSALPLAITPTDAFMGPDISYFDSRAPSRSRRVRTNICCLSSLTGHPCIAM